MFVLEHVVSADDDAADQLHDIRFGDMSAEHLEQDLVINRRKVSDDIEPWRQFSNDKSH